MDSSRLLWHGLALGLALTVPLSDAYAQAPDKIAAYNNVASAPVWVAKELGYFKAEGIDATLVLTDGGAVISAAMLSGSVDAGTTGIERPLLLTRKASVRKNLVGTKMGQIYATRRAAGPQPAHRLAHARSWPHSRASGSGVIALGSSADAFAQALFREAGLRPDTDVTRVPVGTGSGLLAAHAEQGRRRGIRARARHRRDPARQDGEGRPRLS